MSAGGFVFSGVIIDAMIYNPPNSDAVLINPDGTVNGPVNPEVLASKGEASALIENLAGGPKILTPAGTNTLDLPLSVGPIRYGKDGRRVLVLSFSKNKAAYLINVEEVYIWWKREPYPGAQWLLTSVDLIRVGKNGELANGIPISLLKKLSLPGPSADALKLSGVTFDFVTL